MIEVMSSLNFIWQFLKPVGSEVLKERLKPKGPAETAKQRAFALYLSLREVGGAIDGFICVLQEYVDRLSRPTPVAEDIRWIADSSVRVEEGAETVVNALVKVTDALTALDPQLGIYRPALVELLAEFGIRETALLGRERRTVLPALSEHSQDSLSIVPEPSECCETLLKAKHNRQLLSRAIEDLRSFVVEEFKFAESF